RPLPACSPHHALRRERRAPKNLSSGGDSLGAWCPRSRLRSRFNKRSALKITLRFCADSERCCSQRQFCLLRSSGRVGDHYSPQAWRPMLITAMAARLATVIGAGRGMDLVG
ncbi:MAG: hypothetical protein P4L50_07800, partial [Anaerolineaceae bacterium]|nr:hypothetical protein [Anaerolineaceae bacterium]